MTIQAMAGSLQSLVDKHFLPDIPDYCSRPPDISSARDIITYAHKLCYTTFAPPGYQAGVTNLRHFRPPMPQEWQLRASQLHQYAGTFIAFLSVAHMKFSPQGELVDVLTSLRSPLCVKFFRVSHWLDCRMCSKGGWEGARSSCRSCKTCTGSDSSCCNAAGQEHAC